MLVNMHILSFFWKLITKKYYSSPENKLGIKDAVRPGGILHHYFYRAWAAFQKTAFHIINNLDFLLNVIGLKFII